MLVLSRKTGQKIIINDDIEILILECNSSGVKIGVNAPRNVKVYREEVYQEIRYANIKSNESTSELVSQLEDLIPESIIDKDKKPNTWKNTIIKKKDVAN